MAAIPNRIVIGNDQSNPILAFENPEIISVNSDTSVSLVGEELYINQFDATVDYFVWEPYVFKPADEPDQTYGPYSGETVSFETDGVANVTEMEVGLAPIQDLHGYANPWPAGGGKNLLPFTRTDSVEINGITFTPQGDGSINVSGTASANTTYLLWESTISVEAGDYASFLSTSNVGVSMQLRENSSAGHDIMGIGTTTRRTVTVSANTVIIGRLFVSSGTAISGTVTLYPMLAKQSASLTVDDFEPYQNICPIVGHSGANAYVKPAYDTSATATVSVTFTDQGTVYGGSYDFVSGKLTVTHGQIASYAGETLPGVWISDRDVYAAGTTPTTGAQVVYELATPIVYDLTPQTIQTLSGQNVAWSNAGSINTFTAVLQGESCDGFMSSDNKLLCSKQNYDIRLLPYGTKIVYYMAGNIAGVFYVKTVERVQRAWYKISAVSAIGLLDKQNHTGGIYTGQYFQDVVTDILGNDYDYIIDGVVAIQRVYGWLPYDTKRNNLYQLLLAYGVEIVLGDSGAMFFTFPESTEAIPISTDRVFTGGKVIYDEPASLVEVSEHSYHYDPNVDEVVLFDNSTDEAVTFAIIKFDEPIYPTSIYCASGNLTISETTTNYAVVSGAGILKGIPYVHNVRLISKTNANAPVEKVVSVQDATLVSFINADNVLERLSEYYFNATRVEQDIKVLTEKPGQLYTTQDPFNQIITGYIIRMSKSVTSFARARCRFLQNYTPVGSGQAYTQRVVIPLGQGASETWTIPASVFEKDIPIFRVVLIGKGRDGENGQNGKRGGGDGYKAMPGGAGGKGGSGGVGGNVLTVTLNATGLTSITVANSGTESVLMSQFYNYSSADGGPNTFGYFDILTGELLAVPGLDGMDGGNGGYGDYYTHNATAESTAEDGGDVVYNGTAYHGGTHGNRRVIGGGQVGISESIRIYVAGTGGGGAAVGSDGGDGLNTATKLGSAGNGANADPAPPASLVYGAGGNGGHGGGGGGGRGMSEWYNVTYQAVIGTNYPGDNGYGGTGSSGTPGQFGCAIIYY